MKRKLRLLLPAIILVAGSMTACDEYFAPSYPPHNHSSSSSSEKESSSSAGGYSSYETSSSEKDESSNENANSEGISNLDFNAFTNAIKNAKPSDVVTTTKYVLDEMAVTLHHNSHLQIDYSESDIKAKYDYRYEKLNPIGSAEMISTLSGTYYARGNSYGEVINGGINWNTDTEGHFSFLAFFLSENYFSDIQIAQHKLKGTIKDECIEDLFLTKYDIKSLALTLTLDSKNEKITSVSASYISLKYNATITTEGSYSYVPCTVTIPQ